MNIRAESIDLKSLCSALKSTPTKNDLKYYFIKSSLTIKGERPKKDVLILLKFLFEKFEVRGPLVLKFTTEDGPQKFYRNSKEPGVVYISKNASELLLGSSLNKVASDVCLNKSKKRSFTIEYTNTVFEQFMRAIVPKDILLDRLKLHTGLRFRSRPNEKGYDEEQDFRREEIATIYKQFIDIPKHVFEQMKLELMSRYRQGNKLPNDAAADYTKATGKLRIADAATMTGKDIYGEGTIIHELGHAFSARFPTYKKDSYFNISWKKENGKWVLKSKNSQDMVSSYAMKNHEEDFAVHFSAYVNTPEYLKKTSAIKYNFFRDEIFKDTEFFSTAAKNAKVMINSATTDTVKPRLLYELKHSVKLNVVTQNQVSKINVKVVGAFDDLSGIADTIISLEHEFNKEYRVLINLKPKREGNSFTLTGEKLIASEKIASGKYLLKTLPLSDKAGNRIFYKENPISSVELIGSLSVEKFKTKVDYKAVIIETLEPIAGHPTFKILIPTLGRSDYKSIHLNWELSGIEENTVHVFTNKEIKEENGKIMLKFSFYKNYPNLIAKLSAVLMSFNGTKNFSKEKIRTSIPASARNTHIDIKTGKESFDINEVNINALSMKAVEIKNKHDGIHNIEVEIPIINEVEDSKSNLTFRIRKPKTGGFSNAFHESNYNSDQIRRDKKGNKFIKVIIPLKKFPESGEYILESIKIKTKPKRVRVKGLKLDHANGFTKRYKLLERGIRKTFKITNDNQMILP